MKRLVILFMLVAFTLTGYAQHYPLFKMYKTQDRHGQLRLDTTNGEIKLFQNNGKAWGVCPARTQESSKAGRFCLYETQTMRTVIVLDTYTGRSWQVRYGRSSKERSFAYPINTYSFAHPKSTSVWSHRFQMSETEDPWTYILLDSYNGRLWQVQFDSQHCTPINEEALAVNNEKSIFSVQPSGMYQFILTNDVNGEMWKFEWNPGRYERRALYR